MNVSNYTCIKDINIMENKRIIILLNILTIPVMALAIPLFIGIAHVFALEAKDVGFYVMSYPSIGMLFLLFVGVIMVHELIHGAFMKRFNKQGKVLFGFKNGMAYATSPGSMYSKAAFTIISIAPFILLSGLFLAAYLMRLMSFNLFVGMASLHAGGCVGDFYWVYLISRSPKKTLIEDTETGIRFYSTIKSLNDEVKE